MVSDQQLRLLADDLCAVPGVRAVALGGSRARGTHRPDSDYDLGLYVEADVDRAGIAAVASRWTGGDVVVAPAGGWGPWVDSGAWLDVQGDAVDLILRDVGRVAEQCARAVRGELAFHVQPGHPLGFLDVAYAGEVATCVPLADPTGLVGALARTVTPYPPRLRDAMLDHLWQVDFLLDAALKGVGQADVGYVALCAATATMLLAHGWHAVAGQWVLNEKGLVAGVDRLPVTAGGFGADAAALLGSMGTTTAELRDAVAGVRRLPRPDAVPSPRAAAPPMPLPTQDTAP